jgi:hypothetical protein
MDPDIPLSRLKSMEAEYRRELENACFYAGLSSVGSNAVLLQSLADLKEDQELKWLCQEHASDAPRKRKQDEREEREDHLACVNRDLRQASKRGDLTAVRDAIKEGADLNDVCRRHHKSALIKACSNIEDSQTAATIVRELLRHGASVRQPCSNSWMPLHWACAYSSAEVVAMLIDAKASLEWWNDDKETALHAACSRIDDEAIHVVRLLLNKGAKVEPLADAAESPLLAACRCGRTDVVDLIIQRGAFVYAHHHHDDEDVFMSATRNKLYGGEIVAALLDRKVGLGGNNNEGDDVMGMACNQGNVAVIRALKKHAPNAAWREFDTWHPSWSTEYGDMLGLMDEMVPLGYVPRMVDFTASEWTGPAMSWGMLRRCLPDISTVFGTLSLCRNLRTWYWAACELGNVRHPTEGTTLLHVAVKANNTEAVDILMKLWLNPFIRDKERSFPINKTEDATMRSKLIAYATQPPRREVVRWYGPCFFDRAVTWMLCVLRWRQTGRRFIPKDVALMIVHCVMGLETV